MTAAMQEAKQYQDKILGVQLLRLNIVSREPADMESIKLQPYVGSLLFHSPPPDEVRRASCSDMELKPEVSISRYQTATASSLKLCWLKIVKRLIKPWF